MDVCKVVRLIDVDLELFHTHKNSTRLLKWKKRLKWNYKNSDISWNEHEMSLIAFPCAIPVKYNVLIHYHRVMSNIHIKYMVIRSFM